MLSEDPAKPWYETAFGSLYPLIYAHRDDASAAREVRDLLRLLELRGGERVLDACCGNGRHAQALAGAGMDVWGMDLSPPLLEKGRARSALAGRLVQGDLRALPFRPAFDLVLNLFTSFGYFPREEDDRSALGEMVSVLRRGGRLLVDHMNRFLVERNLVPSDAFARKGARIHETRRIEGRRVVKEIRVETREGRRFHLQESVRLFDPGEMVDLFEGAGLKRVRLFGDYGGAPFHEGSRRMIAVGTRE